MLLTQRAARISGASARSPIRARCRHRLPLPCKIKGGSCPSGWTAGASKCYKRVSTGNQAQCHTACNLAGGELPCVETDAENTFIPTVTGLTPEDMRMDVASELCVARPPAKCRRLKVQRTIGTDGMALATLVLEDGRAGQPADDAYDPATQTMTPGAGDNNCAIQALAAYQCGIDPPSAPCRRASVSAHRMPLISPPPAMSPPPPPPPSRCRRTRIAPPAGSNSRQPLFRFRGGLFRDSGDTGEDQMLPRLSTRPTRPRAVASSAR